MVLDNCRPTEVFKFFEEISMIPRGSGNEKAVSDYIAGFARARGLWVHQDEKNNLVIKKPGSPGYESSPAVIIQGHLDMVNEKNNDTVHDFTKDPLKLVVDGDFIRADGTTLGADNGIAVAMAMALLDRDDIKHPSLEILLTVEEETGMGGASAVDGSLFEGKYLLNLDMEDESSLTTSCAGGIRVRLKFPAESAALADGFCGRRLTVKGLRGGHSGADIHLERANSNRLLARVINSLSKTEELYFSDFNGGSKENAIPREAQATVFFPAGSLEKVERELTEIRNNLKREYRASEPTLEILLEETSVPADKALTGQLCQKIIAAIMLIPNGVQAMSLELPGLVETSNNIGVVTTEEDFITIICAVRSSVPTRKYFVRDQIELVGALLSAETEVQGDYPGWEYDPDSHIRRKMIESYSAVYGKEPNVMAIHAGLECGLLMERIPGVDAISLGPNLYDVHTPDERLSISSTERVWEFLVKTLESLK